MKVKLILSALLLSGIATAQTKPAAQAKPLAVPTQSVRVAIKKPTNRVSIVGTNGPKGTLYYLNDEKVPFTGSYIVYNDNDQKDFEANYKNGLADGEWTSWKYNGDQPYIFRKETFKNGKKQGEFTEWSSPTVKYSTTFYDKDETHGQAVMFTSRGDTSSIKYYKHGKSDSTWTWFYSKGKMSQQEHHKNGMRQGASTEWYENGKLKAVYMFVDNKMEGVQTSYYENGQKNRERNYKNGEKFGRQVLYRENGTIESEKTYE